MQSEHLSWYFFSFSHYLSWYESNNIKRKKNLQKQEKETQKEDRILLSSYLKEVGGTLWLKNMLPQRPVQIWASAEVDVKYRGKMKQSWSITFAFQNQIHVSEFLKIFILFDPFQYLDIEDTAAHVKQKREKWYTNMFWRTRQLFI